MVDGKTQMFCRICQKAEEKNAFTKGCSDTQKSALKSHAEQRDHIRACSIKSSQQVMHRDEYQKAVLGTVYFMAKEGIPDSNLSSLVKLQQINQCPSFTKAEVYSYHECHIDGRGTC